MKEIPDYAAEKIYKITNEEFEKRELHLEKTICFTHGVRKNDFESTLNINSNLVLAVIQYYEQDHSLQKIIQLLRKNGMRLSCAKILTILKKYSPRFNELRWEPAKDKMTIELFLKLVKSKTPFEAWQIAKARYCVSKPKLMDLLHKNGINYQEKDFEKVKN